MRTLARGAAVLLLASSAACLWADEASQPVAYSVELGFGRGSIYKGLVTLPVEWTAVAPELDVAVARRSSRFDHSLRLSLARSTGIDTNGVRRLGSNSYAWLPAEYSFSWYCWRDMLGLSRLDLGLGATAQWSRLRETVDLQEGHRTSHIDRLFGLGLNAPLRWRSRKASWKADMRFSLVVSPPLLNSSAVRSDLVPTFDGGLVWGRVALSAGVRRLVARRWTLGVAYDHDAYFLLRTRPHTPLSATLSAGNYLISGLTIRVACGW